MGQFKLHDKISADDGVDGNHKYKRALIASVSPDGRIYISADATRKWVENWENAYVHVDLAGNRLALVEADEDDAEFHQAYSLNHSFSSTGTVFGCVSAIRRLDVAHEFLGVKMVYAPISFVDGKLILDISNRSDTRSDLVDEVDAKASTDESSGVS